MSAIVWDWQSWWALELEWRPSVDLQLPGPDGGLLRAALAGPPHRDFVHPEGDLPGYPLVLVPSLYLTTPAAAENLTAYVRPGGTLVVSYFSGIVDEHDAVHPGGHPGALRDLLGLEVEEFLPLRARRTGRPRATACPVTSGPSGSTSPAPNRWLRYVDGPAAGGPAVTRHRVGDGLAWYVSTRLGGADLDAVLREAGLTTGEDCPTGSR